MSKTPADQVDQFLTAFAAGYPVEETAFGRLLLENHAGRLDGKVPASERAYEMLVEITRQFLEARMLVHLQSLQSRFLKLKEQKKHCAAFWSAVGIHMELFLLNDPLDGPALAQAQQGQHHILIGSELFRISDKGLNTTNVYQLITGRNDKFEPDAERKATHRAFVDRYLKTYLASQDLRSAYWAAETEREILFSWLTHSRRKFYEATHELRADWWRRETGQPWPAATSSPKRQEPAPDDILRPADAKVKTPVEPELPLQPEPADLERVTAKPLENTPAGHVPGTVQAPAVPERVQLEEQLVTACRAQAASFSTESLFWLDFVHTQDHRSFLPINIKELLSLRGWQFLVSLPGGGKTTLQHWLAKERVLRNLPPALKLFVSLPRFMETGQGDLYQYMAEKLPYKWKLTAEPEQLQTILVELENQEKLIWHFEGWDQLDWNQKDWLLDQYKKYHRAFISTSEQARLLPLLEKHGLDREMVEAVHLCPIDEGKRFELMGQVPQSRRLENFSAWDRLSNELSGLARLPLGFRYLAKNLYSSPIDILLGFLTVEQTRLGHPPVSLRIDRQSSPIHVDWSNPWVDDAYQIAVNHLALAGLEQFMEPIATIRGFNLKFNTMFAFHPYAKSSGLFYEIAYDQHHFVVPEIGYLFIAVHTFLETPRQQILYETAKYLARNARYPYPEFFKTFAGWTVKSPIFYPQLETR